MSTPPATLWGMAETWFTSDLHLGHDFVARHRGFSSHEEHDAELARRWDKRVRDGDEVWVLGDVAMNGWYMRLDWFRDRPGIKHLVLGNHDRAHPSQRNAHAHMSAYLDNFSTVQTAAKVSGFLLSHFPYDGEGEGRRDDEDRHTQWRLRDEGTPLLHGHLHDTITGRLSLRRTPMIHVGLDAWGLRPATLHEVRTVFA